MIGTKLALAYVAAVLAVTAVVDSGLRAAWDAVDVRGAVYAVYEFEHGAFVAVPEKSLEACHEFQAAARDQAHQTVHVKPPISIEAAGIVKGAVYRVVGISCPDDVEGE